MQSEVWENLYKDSVQLTKPAQVKQLLSAEEMEAIQLLIKEVIDAFLEKGTVHVGLKTYVNKKLRNDMTGPMLANRPSSFHSIESWSKYIFGEEKFGMVLNSLEEYSNEFSEKAAMLVRPLLEHAGLPLGGLAFLFFMGNYGFTPFGVHKEAPGEEGILFHLGPGKKQFYTWDDPIYNAMAHNKTVFHDFDSMLDHAMCYELEPGDAMFIPHQVYHIANTTEFSLSFVMDYINPGSELFLNQLALDAGNVEVAHENNYLSPVKMDTRTAGWEQILDPSSLQKKVDIAFRRKILELKSNGGILRKSKIISSTRIPNGSFLIKSKSAFPIYLDEQSNNNILVFARGHRISSKTHPKLPQLIGQLNNGETIDISYIRNILEPEWDMIDIFGLLGKLLQIEAIIADYPETENQGSQMVS